MGKIDWKKQQKRSSLLDSAFSLFINNGFNKTSVSDITNDAGVAKGTFYLYFKDKYDLRNHLIIHKANQIFHLAYDALLEHPEISSFEERILFITDHVLDQLAANLNLARLLSKHLSWGFIKTFVYAPPSDDQPSIYTIYESLLSDAHHCYRNPELMMYSILELAGGMSYNAILFHEPMPLEQMKPFLYESIRGIIKQYQN